jgi:ribosomal protein L29
MTSQKMEETKKLSKTDREKRLKELKLELMKSSAGAGKGNNTKEIKKMIARIHTLNNSKEGLSK